MSSPIKRFPVRISVPSVEETPRQPPSKPQERAVNLEDAIRDNDGLKHAIEIFEGDDSAAGYKRREPAMRMLHIALTRSISTSQSLPGLTTP